MKLPSELRKCFTSSSRLPSTSPMTVASGAGSSVAAAIVSVCSITLSSCPTANACTGDICSTSATMSSSDSTFRQSLTNCFMSRLLSFLDSLYNIAFPSLLCSLFLILSYLRTFLSISIFLAISFQRKKEQIGVMPICSTSFS